MNKHNLFFVLILLQFLVAETGCEKALDLKKPNSNATAVFNEVWNTLDQRYVLFSVKNINWDSVYNGYRSQVTDEMDNAALFSLIDDMLQTLRDGHVSLQSATDTATYQGFYQLYLTNFNYSNIVNNYLDNDYKVAGPLVYKINDGIGYIYYGSFTNDITDELLDYVLQQMSTTKGLILDVRNNTGGSTKNADKLFQRFINEGTLVKYEVGKKSKLHDDFYTPVSFNLSPNGVHYNKPVCVLTNRSCFSACNDFVMYMSLLGNVTLVGDNTGGGGGIPTDYILGNGWKLQYTATATLTPDKQYIENGIAPDLSVNITPIEEMNGIDPILDKALEVLQ